MSFVDRLNNLFSEIDSRRFLHDTMQELGANGPEDPDAVISDGTFARGVRYLEICCRNVELRDRQHYLPVFKHLYMGVNDYQSAIECIYRVEHFLKLDYKVPQLRDYYRKYDDELREILTDYAHAQPEELDRFVRRFGFLLMIAPKDGIKQAVMFCGANESLIPKVFELLEYETSLFKLRILKDGYGETQTEAATIVSFRELLKKKEIVEAGSKQDRQRYQTVMAKFAKTRISERQVNGMVRMTSLVDATEFMEHFILYCLRREQYIGFVIGVLREVLQSCRNERALIEWKPIGDEQVPNKLMVDAAKLLTILLKLYMASSMDDEKRDLISDTIEKLALRLKDDGWLFPNCDFLLNTLNSMDWSRRYCVMKWISHAIVDCKLQVPWSIYNRVSLNERDQFNLLDGSSPNDDESAQEGLLRAIFSIGTFSCREALSLVDAGFLHSADRNVSSMLAKALLDSLLTSTTAATVDKIFSLVMRLSVELDVPKKSFYANKWIESNYTSLQEMVAIEVLAESIRMSIESPLKEMPHSKKVKPGSDTRIILQSFCGKASGLVREQEAICKMESDSNQCLKETEVAAAFNSINILSLTVKSFIEKIENVPFCLLDLHKQLVGAAETIATRIYGKEFFETKHVMASSNVSTSRLVTSQSSSVNGLSIRQPNYTARKTNKQSFGFFSDGSQKNWQATGYNRQAPIGIDKRNSNESSQIEDGQGKKNSIFDRAGEALKSHQDSLTSNKSVMKAEPTKKNRKRYGNIRLN